jgi:hypothetical protein
MDLDNLVLADEVLPSEWEGYYVVGRYEFDASGGPSKPN